MTLKINNKTYLRGRLVNQSVSADTVTGAVSVVESDGEEVPPSQDVDPGVGGALPEGGPGEVDGAHEDAGVCLDLEGRGLAVVEGAGHVRCAVLVLAT